MNFKDKIALGSVQFGLDYGINNKTGKIKKSEVFKILDYARSSGISFIDTAYDYGESESVLGSYFSSEKRFNVISKLPVCKLEKVEILLNDSLRRLKIEKLYAYLIHDFNTFVKNKNIFSKLIALKNKDKISKIGFSLYYPSQLKYLLNYDYNFDIVQIPFSIFDQRFLPYLPLLKDRDIEIHVRSVFLQGLVFKDINKLDFKFLKYKKKLNRLNNLSEVLGISNASICLNFALLNCFIDKVVIGVDSFENLQNNISSIDNIRIVNDVYKKLSALKDDDENFILPINW